MGNRFSGSTAQRKNAVCLIIPQTTVLTPKRSEHKNVSVVYSKLLSETVLAATNNRTVASQNNAEMRPFVIYLTTPHQDYSVDVRMTSESQRGKDLLSSCRRPAGGQSRQFLEVQ